MEAPDLSREITYSVAEHQILLEFNGDVDAEMFNDWWNTDGFKLFEKWATKHAKDYA